MKKLLVIGIFAFVVAAWLSHKFFVAGKASTDQARKTQGSSEQSSESTQNQSSNSQDQEKQPASVPQGNSRVSREKANFIAKYPGNWTFHESTSGEIRSLMGGSIPKVAASEESALNFLREIAPMLGTRPENLKLSMIQPTASGRTQSYRVEQVVDGFRVYQGQATLIGNKKTGDGIIVNSTIRDVQFRGATPQFTALQAEDQILIKYQLEPGDAGLTNPDPVLFETQPGQVELAWVFSADLKNGPKGSHEVVVSAITGNILYLESRSAN